MHIVPVINIAMLVLVAVISTATTQTQGVVGQPQQQQRLRMKRNRAAAGTLRQEAHTAHSSAHIAVAAAVQSSAHDTLPSRGILTESRVYREESAESASGSEESSAAATPKKKEEEDVLLFYMVGQPDPSTTDRRRCANRKTEKFQIVGRQDERTCGWYVYRNMCDNSVTDDDGGGIVSDVCQKSCGKCVRNGLHAPASVDLPPPTPSRTKAIIPPPTPQILAATTDVGTGPTFAPTQTYNPTSTATMATTTFPPTTTYHPTYSPTSATTTFPPTMTYHPTYSPTSATTNTGGSTFGPTQTYNPTFATTTYRPTSTYHPTYSPTPYLTSETWRPTTVVTEDAAAQDEAVASLFVPRTPVLEAKACIGVGGYYCTQNHECCSKGARCVLHQCVPSMSSYLSQLLP